MKKSTKEESKKSISLNQVLIVVIIIASFFLGSLYTKVQYLEKNGAAPAAGQQAQGAQAQPTTPAPGQKVQVDVGHFPVKGDKNAKVTLIEFADMRCPFCKVFQTDVLPQLMKDYVDSGKVKIYYRQYAFLGPASTVAANAVECANDQGKFWDMHDYLFINQPPESDTSMFTTDKMTEIAGTLGMNTERFNSCLSSTKFNKNVTDDFSAGQKAGVSGTPTFYINGLQMVGAQPYTSFQAAIDAELAKK